jgi:hypothetical protein
MQTQADLSKSAPARLLPSTDSAASKDEVRRLLRRALKALAKHPDAAKSSRAQELLKDIDRD